MRRSSSVVGIALAGAVVVCGIAASVLPGVVSAKGVENGEWRNYSGDNGSTKYSPLAQIDAGNVSTLKVAWRRPATDPSFSTANPALRPTTNFRSTPIMVGGVLYASNGQGFVEAFDPSTGKTIWVQKIDPADATGGANRGVAYWGEGADARIISHTGHFLYALDPRTGDPIQSFGTNGRVDLNVGLAPLQGQYRWGSVPLVVRDVIVMGSNQSDQDSATKMEGAVGEVRAFDVRTGRPRWTFKPIPHPGEEGNDSWENDAWSFVGAANVWSLMSADDELGVVYLPTTSVTNDMYGGHRPGANLFSDCIVAIDAASGKRLWYFQTVKHDLFDYDNPAAPILGDITVDGRRIKALIQVTKQSWAYVLDRTTGKPVWPMEERPVPASTVPGEKASPTQLFPTKPPAFDRQGVTVDDLIDFTPELRAQALEIVKQYVIGPVFTPPSVAGPNPGDKQGTIELPGSVGGADWTGAAFDPETAMLYVPSITNPFVANLIPGEQDRTNLRFRAGDRRLLQGPQGLPLMKPPYGRITAIDLNKGDIAWMVANGDGPRNHPLLKDLQLPPLGQAVRAAPLVTKSLLFVTEGDQVNVRTPPAGGGKKMRAYDKQSGKVLWETEFGAGSTGTLMTYMHNNKQFVVIAIGGQGYPPEFVALSLP
ncbi:MAG TPA: PQQ-binding-like beta-propeller repeat protein [Vicinamibacterales bacterium]|jgi:quinoprotein glucose dehydrogenase|nr:PQQ-binding-like beta-propeller repeat protein [Vicinamibacterales bacterium]